MPGTGARRSEERRVGQEVGVRGTCCEQRRKVVYMTLETRGHVGARRRTDNRSVVGGHAEVDGLVVVQAAVVGQVIYVVRPGLPGRVRDLAKLRLRDRDPLSFRLRDVTDLEMPGTGAR